MSYTDPDDGCTYLSRGEHFHYSGHVTVSVRVSFDADDESSLNSNYDDALSDAIMDAVACGDFEVEDDDSLDCEVEDDDHDC